VTPPRCPDSLSDVTNVNGPSGVQRWVIAICFAGGLALGFFVVFGFIHKWGANQWGPLAAWLAGAATFAAVVVALRQSAQARREARRGHLARLVDHEVSRRRECIEALANFWAAITGMDMNFAAWTGRLQTGSLDSIPNELQRFSREWQNRIEPPLIVAQLVLRDTPLGPAVAGVNDTFNEMKTEGLEPIRQAAKDGQRPDAEPITSMWENVWNRRNEHLILARKHFSLSREDVERYVVDQLST
jgi:hypothetical protein